jgi:hypothetical protein
MKMSNTSVVVLAIVLICVVALSGSYALPQTGAASSEEVGKLLQMHDSLTRNWKWKEDKCHLIGDQMYHNLDVGVPANALVTTPCMTPHVIGNRIAMYFEFFLCARNLGLNFISVHKTDGTVSESHPFFQALPDVATNALRAGPYPSTEEVRRACPCDAFCHDKKHALIFDNMNVPIDMFRRAIDAYWTDRTRNYGWFLHQTMVDGSDGASIHMNNLTTTVSKQDVAAMNLPAIPDVVIQYRIANVLFAYDYGFISYWAVADRIPSDARTIYIVSDSPLRHEEGNDSQDVNRKKKAFWQPVLEGLLAYLRSHFSKATILLLRGQESMDDLARLSLAKVTICSPSTYCFWPAIASRTQAFFPKTPLINAGETRNISDNFHWMHENYIRGTAVNIDAGADALVKMLSTRS